MIDAAHPNRDEQIAAVDAVLEEIGADRVPQMRVYNKIDVDGICARAASATRLVYCAPSA